MRNWSWLKLYPYVIRTILSKDERRLLEEKGVTTIERRNPYTDKFGEIRHETQVFFLSETPAGWKRIGYGRAILTDDSPNGRYDYQIILDSRVTSSQ